MKKAVMLFVVLALIVASWAVAAAEESAAERFCGRWQDPYYGRAMLTIAPAEGEDASWFDAVIRWGSSASSEGVWTMRAQYDAAEDALVYASGTLTDVEYAEGGDVTSEAVQWDDAVGRFTFDGDVLLWADSREERAAEFRLQPVPKLAPTAQEITERYYGPVADWAPGTAGSSLKLAGVCAALMEFSDEYCMWDADVPALRANLLEAWSMLDETTRRRFDEGLPEVEALMETAMSDYASVAGLFDDAGAGHMAWLAKDDGCRRSWRALLDYTHTMGDGE